MEASLPSTNDRRIFPVWLESTKYLLDARCVGTCFVNAAREEALDGSVFLLRDSRPGYREHIFPAMAGSNRELRRRLLWAFSFQCLEGFPKAACRGTYCWTAFWEVSYIIPVLGVSLWLLCVSPVNPSTSFLVVHKAGRIQGRVAGACAVHGQKSTCVWRTV